MFVNSKHSNGDGCLSHDYVCLYVCVPDWPAETLCSPVVRSSVHSSDTKLVNTIFSIVMQIGTSGPQGKGIKLQLLGSVGQRSRSHEGEDRLEAWPGAGIILNPFDRVVFIDIFISILI